MKKLYKINTTDGVRWAIGVFHNGEFIKGGSPKYYKTKKNAMKALLK